MLINATGQAVNARQLQEEAKSESVILRSVVLHDVLRTDLGMNDR